MLSIGRLEAGQEGYYLGAVATGIDEYYTVRGEVAGRWTADGSARLGLAGSVDGAVLRAVLAGQDPTTGAQVASSARTVWAFDLTFSAPKSVSVLFALAGWEVRRDVIAGHETAVDAALGYLEREALFSRRGHAGSSRVATDGFIAAAFRHRTSRAGDPQLHTHVVAANLAQGLDGEWGTLDSRSLYRHARTAGYLYQAQLRAELRDRLGVTWRPVTKGSAELNGVPDRVLREFSQRRAQIESVLDERGESSRGAAQLATLATRSSKKSDVDLVNLHEEWTARAAALRFEPGQLSSVLERTHREPVKPAAEMELGEELTWEHSSFDRRDVLRALAARAATGRRVAAIEAAADEFLDSPAVVPLGNGRWTTPEMLRVETMLVRDALELRHAGFGLTGPGTGAADDLDPEQAQTVDRLTGSGDGVEVVVGVAGAGKTHTLAAATRAWHDTGYRVIGTALAARAANHLGDVIGAEALTMTRLLQQADAYGSGWLAGSVVIVDEAGMVGTRQLARLLEHARTGAKVVLVGDPKQLPEIEAGGAFAALARRLSANELRSNRRQTDPAERAALAELRAGKVEASVAHLARARRITVADNAAEARTHMIVDWLAARDEGRDVVMLARRTRDVTSLNFAARAALVERGDVQRDGMLAGEHCFAVGDRVMTRRNDRMLGVVNGEIATVAAIGPRRRTVELRAEDGTAKTLTASYVAGGHLTYAYAMTVHKAQGLTVDTALVLADDGLFREAAYTALSRGRTRNQLYLVGTDLERQEERHAPERTSPDPVDAFSTALARSAAKRLALDEPRAASVDRASAERTDIGLDLGW